MSKDFNISILMDFYGGLLTEKQLEAMDCYYNQDYSLQEIAEYMDISRQGVRDFIKRGEKQLIDFENKLKLSEKFMYLNSLTDRLLDDVKAIENSIDTVGRNSVENIIELKNGSVIADMKKMLYEMKDNL